MAQITVSGNVGTDPEIKFYDGKNGSFGVARFFSDLGLVEIVLLVVVDVDFREAAFCFFTNAETSPTSSSLVLSSSAYIQFLLYLIRNTLAAARSSVVPNSLLSLSSSSSLLRDKPLLVPFFTEA